MSRLRTNRVCFTINNYDVEAVQQFEQWFDNDKNIVYGIVGQEIGESGTPHLQGFVHYNEDRKKCGIKWWKDLVPSGGRAHFEAARGSDADNNKYCEKDGVFLEVGTAQENTDQWARIFETAKTDLEAALSINAEVSIKYYNQLKAIYNDHNCPQMDAQLEVLRDWQNCVMQKLQQQTDRQILFVVDEQGGKGKSVLAKHIITTTNAWACQGT